MSSFHNLRFMDFNVFIILFSHYKRPYSTVFKAFVKMTLKYVKKYKHLFTDTPGKPKGTISD